MRLDRAEAGRLMKSTQYAMKQLSLQMIMASALARAQEWTEATAEQKEVIKAKERAAQSAKVWDDIQSHHHHVSSDAEAEADDEDKEEEEEEEEAGGAEEEVDDDDEAEYELASTRLAAIIPDHVTANAS